MRFSLSNLLGLTGVSLSHVARHIVMSCGILYGLATASKLALLGYNWLVLLVLISNLVLLLR